MISFLDGIICLSLTIVGAYYQSLYDSLQHNTAHQFDIRQKLQYRNSSTKISRLSESFIKTEEEFSLNSDWKHLSCDTKTMIAA